MTRMTDINWGWKNELYSAKSPREELAYYEKTAKDYEFEFRGMLKYCGPEMCMQTLLDCETQLGENNFHVFNCLMQKREWFM